VRRFQPSWAFEQNAGAMQHGWKGCGFRSRVGTAYCFGDAWCRPGLDRKTRSLITLAALTALTKPNQIKNHVRGALANGASVEEIREVLLHTAIYAGIPAGVEAFNAASEVLNNKVT
jgi:4-carboxymuconolactone decarboxylase